MPTLEHENLKRDVLRRFSPLTREAALEFRRTGDLDQLSMIIRGLIEHCVDRSARDRLKGSGSELRLVEDLAVDSLTMLEIVFLAEEVLEISIESDELRGFRTVGDIEKFAARKLGRSEKAPCAR